MSVKYTGGQVKKVAEALNADYETAEEAALAVLALADELWRERAAYVVVGQLSATRDRLTVPPSDPEAIKLCLGFYSTEAEASAASHSLWNPTTSGDTFRTWVLNVENVSPADWHKGRRDRYVALEAKQAEVRAERTRKQIEKVAREAAERAAGKGACECGHQPAEHMTEGNSRGKCFPGCAADCTKFTENKNWAPVASAA